MATIVKHIKIGTPIRRVLADVPNVTTENITDFDISGKSHADILVYDSASGKFKSSAITGSNGINVNYDSNVNISLEASGATAGSYGTIARIPVISVNAQGLIDSIGEVSVSVVGGNAVTSVDFDSNTGVLSVVTGDGTYTTNITLDAFTTNNLAEDSTNLYYTDERARLAISVVDEGDEGALTYDATEGVLTYSGVSTEVIRNKFTAGNGITIVDGEISVSLLSTLNVAGIETDKFSTTDSGLNVVGNILPDADSAYDLGSPDKKWRSLYVSGNTIYLGSITLEDEGGSFTVRDALGNVAPLGFGDNTTSDLAEGSNLYYTDARFDSALSGKTTDDVTEGSNLYYTPARFNTAFTGKSTTDLSEGTNLYYTQARVEAVVDTTYIQSRQTTYDLSPYATINYVDSAVAALVDASPAALNTLNELAAALGDDANFSTSITNALSLKLNISDFATYAQATLAGLTTNDITEGPANLYYTETRVTNLVDSAYVQARQADILDSAARIAAVISIATDLVDSAYVQARQITYDFLDSSEVINLIDSDYVQSRVTFTDHFDSADVATVVDSDYVQARQTPQDFAYSSLTGTPNILDSVNVTDLVDSAYVQNRVSNTPTVLSIQIDSNLPVDTTNTLYQQDGTLYWNGASLQDSGLLGYIAVNKAGDTMTGDLTIEKSNPKILFNDTADGTVEVAMAVHDENFYIYEPEDPLGTQVPAGLGVGKQWLTILDASQQIKAFGYTVWHQGNDGAGTGLDADLLDGQEGSYYSNYNNLTNKPSFIDSVGVIALVDSAYVQLRQLITGELVGLDSIDVQSIIDSAHVQARQDYSYSSLVDLPDFLDSNDVTLIVDSAYIQARQLDVGSGGIDSAATINLITLAVDNAYVQARQLHYLDSALTTQLIDDAYVQARQTNYLDSALAIELFDSAYIQARQTPAVDSVGTIALINATVDAAYVQNRQITYDFLDSSEVINLIDSAYVQARETYSTATQIFDAVKTQDGTASGLDADLLDGFQGSYYLDYNNFSNVPVILDSTNVKNIFSVGNGLTYNNGTGQFGIDETDSVTFNSLTVANDLNVDGDLYVNGTQYVTAVQTLSISNSLIHLADSNEVSDIVDIGILGHYSPDGGATRQHAGFFRDATDKEFYLFSTYVSDALDSDPPSLTIDRSDPTFSLATLNVARIAGVYEGFDSDLATKTTNDITEGSNLYYTDARVSLLIDSDYIQARQNLVDSSSIIALVDSAYVQARQDYAYASLTGTPNILDSGHVIAIIDSDYVKDRQDYAYASLTDAPNILDSNDIITLVDSAYVQLRETPQDFAYASLTGTPNILDSGDIITLVDSAYVQARETPQDFDYGSLTNTPNVLDSGHVTAIVLNTIDSDYVSNRVDVNTIASLIDIGGVGYSSFAYEATADQDTFTESDFSGNVLTYAAGKVQVYQNGVQLVSTQYDASSGNAIVLTNPADSGDVIAISSYTATNGLFNARDSGDGLVITGDIDVRGTSLLRSSTEEIQVKTSATGVVNHDFTLGSTFYHSGMTSDFTVNIQNAPTTNNRAFTVAILMQQSGSGPYIPSALQVNGSGVTIKWAEDTEPLGYLNNLDLVTFTVIKVNDTYTALGQMITYG